MNINVRPSRVPSPTPSHVVTQAIEDASFHEVERPNNLPARAERQQPAPSQPIPDRTESEQVVSLPATGFAKLAAAIAAVMAEIKPVEKEGWNDFHKYNYAKMQDLSRELTPLMGKHGIVIFQTEEGREMFDEGRAVAVRYRFTIVHSSGEIWPEHPIQTGLSMCRTSNGKFDDKTLNKCHTSARKYFLLSLFQIPTADDDDADGGGEDQGAPQARPQGQSRRPVPSPSGKLAPHAIAIIDGEAPQDWASRFGAFIAKAESEDEVNKWYTVNAAVFEKLKKGGFTQVYNDVLDVMDARVAKLNGTKADPISTGKPAAAANDFPGDKKMAPADDGLDIPPNLRRTAPKKPTLKDVSADEHDWLQNLGGAFTGCEDLSSLGEQQNRLMTPYQGKVSATAWTLASDLLDEHVERIQGGEQ